MNQDFLDIGDKEVHIENVAGCTFNFRQCMDIEKLHLDTFWKRLRWLLKGK